MPFFEVLGPDFLGRLLLNVLALLALVRLGLSGKGHGGSTFFIHYMFGIGVFFVTYTLKSEEMSLGFTFGLFAIFSMLRYRTELLMLREMTYLFLVIVISLLCAVSPLGIAELGILVALIIVIALVAESPLASRPYRQQTVRYEKIDNIKPENRAQLLQDLRGRTGLDVRDVQIVSIDFMQDSAMLNLVHYVSHGEPESIPVVGGQDSA